MLESSPLIAWWVRVTRWQLAHSSKLLFHLSLLFKVTLAYPKMLGKRKKNYKNSISLSLKLNSMIKRLSGV